jgi:transglutaminase-like putative cysteine protease
MLGRPKPIPASERPERAQILGLTLLVIAAYLPLAPELAAQISRFIGLVWALRLAALRWPAALPGRWVLVGLTLLGVGNAVLAYQGWSGRDAGTALFVSMLMLKLLELRRRDDLRLVVSLLGFLIVVQFLFDQSPWRLVYLAAVLLGMITLLVMLSGGIGTRRVRPALLVATRLALQALPLTLILFLLFPRLSAPLWSLGLDPHRATTGISETLEPGSINELVLSGELAFRVHFEGPAPAAEGLYWRGPVLWQTDGRRWSPGPGIAAVGPPDELLETARLIDYEVTLEPTDQRWWFALDLPVSTPEGARMSADHQLIALQTASTAQRYRVRSALEYRTGPLDLERWAAGLQVPASVTPRMRRLVEGWRAEGESDWGVVQSALRFFNREAFHYTLAPPLLGANPTDEFLFESRRGYCEHYASSFALLMRLAGIPSRIVLGYLGGEPNPVGGYHMVWQSDAHAWTEVWIAARGWVRVDPTAAVDPLRIDNREASRVLGAGSSVRFTLEQADMLVRLARNLRLFADSMDAAWQDWVLGFSLADQLALLQRLRLGELREYGLVALLLPALALTLGLLVLGAMRERHRRDPLAASYAVFCRRLARVGLTRRPSEGPVDFAGHVAAARPDLAPTVERFMRIYLPARYGAAQPSQAPEALAAVLRGFRPRPLRGRSPSAAD